MKHIPERDLIYITKEFVSLLKTGVSESEALRRIQEAGLNRKLREFIHTALAGLEQDR